MVHQLTITGGGGQDILTPTIVFHNILKILRFFFACERLLYFQLYLKGIFTDLTKPMEPCYIMDNDRGWGSR